MKLLLLALVISVSVLSGCKLKTVDLQSQYKGENVNCVWQPTTKCPPYVTYYDSTQKDTLKLHVKNNLIYNSRNERFDTSGADPSHSGRAAIFVMDADGNVFASNVNVVYLFHHSTILAGEPVAAAGELFVNNGVISKITNCSGHYKPEYETTAQLKDVLKKAGYKRDFTYQKCGTADLFIDLDYKVLKKEAEPASGKQ